jgi:hypothetical protein
MGVICKVIWLLVLQALHPKAWIWSQVGKRNAATARALNYFIGVLVLKRSSFGILDFIGMLNLVGTQNLMKRVPQTFGAGSGGSRHD